MLRFILFIGLFLTLIKASAQKTVSEEIWSAQMHSVIMTATFSLDERNVKKLEYIHVMAQDSRYTEIVSIITLFHGSAKDCIDWFNKMISLVENEEVKTSIRNEKQIIIVEKIMGQKFLSISEWDGGSGFRGITQKKLESGLEKLEEWISDKKIDIYQTEKVKKELKEENQKPVQNSIADEILKLKNLMDQGVLTKEEFEAQKKKLLGQ